MTDPPEDDWIALEYHILAVGGERDNQSAKVVRVYGFVSEADLFDFADAQEIPLADHHAAASHLRDYAERTGAIQVYEETGNIPQSYLDYEFAYLDSLEGARKRAEVASAGFIYEDCIAANGGAFPYPRFGFPFMPIGWDDEVSAYFSFGIYGSTGFYDRTFYRRPLLVWWQWGWTRFDFCVPGLIGADNLTSSILSYP